MARKQAIKVSASNLAKHRWAGTSKHERRSQTKNATNAMNKVGHEAKAKAAKKAWVTKKRKGK